MAQLPDHVIINGVKDFGATEDGTRLPLFLGMLGWTPNRNEALSFNTIGEANDWIAAEERRPLLKDQKARAMKHPQVATRDSAPGTAAHDYDPYDAERA